MTTNPTAPQFDYNSFSRWYDLYRAQVLEPALNQGLDALQAVLDQILSDRDTARIRSVTGRVKSKPRTWRKIHQPRYDGRIPNLEDIPNVVDDLVGLRITCINVRDIDMVQTALDGLPQQPGNGLWIDESSERDYVSQPKESGYRGWHVNLGVSSSNVPVMCELQVRTLLQDSWGELTHEDAYSKDGALPPLVDVLSTRMADLLSILDDIAEDLRTELDRIDQELVSETDDPQDESQDVLAGQAAEAASLLQERWASLDRPTDLAALAWELQREFGAEVSDDWFGHSSFKRFLRHAVPAGEISKGRQAYLLPEVEAKPDLLTQPLEPGNTDAEGPSVPGASRQLKRSDPEFPLFEAEEWPALFEYLGESWRRVKPTDANVATSNRLISSSRDLSRAAGAPISRRRLQYVVRALLASEETWTTDNTPPMDASQLAEAFANQTVERMINLRILDDSSSKAAFRVRRWIT